MHLEIRLVDPKNPETSELAVWDTIARAWVLEAGTEAQVVEVMGRAAAARLEPSWRKAIRDLRATPANVARAAVGVPSPLAVIVGGGADELDHVEL